jgi:hypothetical protein
VIAKSRWIAVIAGCLLTIGTLSGASSATASPASGTLDTSGCTEYWYVFTFDGQYLDERSTDLAQTLPYNGAPDEAWCFLPDPSGSGFYYIVNQADGHCLDDGQDYPNLLVYPCDSNSQQQKWNLVSGWILPSDRGGVGLSPRGDRLLVHLTAGNGWSWTISA